jgi:hypothetical protein
MDFLNPRKDYQYNYHKALLEWCEDDPRSLIELQIHQTRGKHSNKRKKFKLNKNEIDYIQSVGLIKVREDIVEYINKRVKKPAPEIKLEFNKTHPINIAKLATGLCCRKCINECFKIGEWSVLSEEEEETYTTVLMKWISSQYLSPKTL